MCIPSQAVVRCRIQAMTATSARRSMEMRFVRDGAAIDRGGVLGDSGSEPLGKAFGRLAGNAQTCSSAHASA